jgi:hypothetical protein
MYSTYIVRRTQIYLEDQQARALARRARTRGVTASHMIREAIDEYLAQPEDPSARELARFRTAIDAAFGSAPELEAGSIYVHRLRRTDAGRARDLEARRHG